MSEEIPLDGAYKPRSALGDVTNQIGKRGFSFISTSGAKSGNDLNKDEGFQSAKKECVRVDNSMKENFHKEITECVLKPHLCPPDVRQNVTSSTGVKSGDIVRDSCISTHTDPSNASSPHVIVEVEDDERTDSAVLPENASKGKAEDNSGTNDDEIDVSLDNLDSSKDEYLDFSRFPESQESRCGLEKCIGQKGDGFSSTCVDLIKACPCSFCMKAAYIWSDLHYQDMKGRIAAIKKSQKEASILVHQNSARNYEKSSNMESDLTGRWKSLFLHMEDIFVREGTQLERSLSTLKELRDNCKTDSEKK